MGTGYMGCVAGRLRRLQSTSKSFLGRPDCRMMLERVPCLTGLWRGTGTVTVDSPRCLCMIRWLPRCRTPRKPFCSRMRQTSRPERILSLPKRDLDLSHEDLSVIAPGDLGGTGGFKEEGECLHQISFGLFNRGSLTGDIELRTERDETIVFAFDDCGESLRRSHGVRIYGMSDETRCRFARYQCPV